MVRRALAANAPVLVLTSLIGFTAYCVYFAHSQQITGKEVRDDRLAYAIGHDTPSFVLDAAERWRFRAIVVHLHAACVEF